MKVVHLNWFTWNCTLAFGVELNTDILKHLNCNLAQTCTLYLWTHCLAVMIVAYYQPLVGEGVYSIHCIASHLHSLYMREIHYCWFWSFSGYCIIGLSQQLSKLNKPTIHLPNNVILSPVDSARNLGVMLIKICHFRNISLQHISHLFLNHASSIFVT